MPDQHPSHYHASLALEESGDVGVARLGDQYAIAYECGALTATVRLGRGEARELALRLIDASQADGEGQ